MYKRYRYIEKEILKKKKEKKRSAMCFQFSTPKFVRGNWIYFSQTEELFHVNDYMWP